MSGEKKEWLKRDSSIGDGSSLCGTVCNILWSEPVTHAEYEH